MVSLRPATEKDLPTINAIYNHYVLHSTCTFQEAPATDAERATWFSTHGPEHPIIVASLNGEVVGWGSLNRFHPRSAYRRTVENSVYVHHNLHGQGIGKAILADLLTRAHSLGHHSIIAVISADQLPSIALHRRAGFTDCGLLREVGFKFGRWLDVVYMQWKAE